MNFNFLVFPAPKPSYTVDTLANQLIWIPNYKFVKKIPDTEIKLSQSFKSPRSEINIQSFLSPQSNNHNKFGFGPKHPPNSIENIHLFHNEANKNNENHNKLKDSMGPALNRGNSKHFYYEDLEDDIDLGNEKPKNVLKYETKNFEQKNAFLKYGKLTQRNTNSLSFKKEKENNPLIGYIPCLIMDIAYNSDYIVLFFHGNGEDIYLSSELVDSLFNALQV